MIKWEFVPSAYCNRVILSNNLYIYYIDASNIKGGCHVDGTADLIVPLLCDMCKEINKPYIYEDVKKSFVNLWSSFLTTFLLKDKNVEGYVGILGMNFIPDITNSKILNASEAFWYIKPNYRGHGLKMVEAMECFIKDRLEPNNFKECNIEFGISNERLLKVLEKKGYNKIKTIIQKKG